MCGYSTGVPAEVITIASLKGGVGKTTSSYALCAAAAAGGLKVIAIDLDPTGGLSNALSGPNAALPSSTSCMVASRLREALIDHPLGIRTVVSHRSLNDESPSKEQLDEMLTDVRDDCDIILLDTHPHEPSLVGPMGAADRIVIPTALDILSLRAAALTRRSRPATRCPRPDPGHRCHKRETAALADHRLAAQRAHAQRARVRDGPLVLAGLGRGHVGSRRAARRGAARREQALLREVATRPSPTEALRQFVGMAQGRGRSPPARSLPDPLPPLGRSAWRRPGRRRRRR